MKKSVFTWVLLLLLMMGLCLAGCAGDSDSPEPPPEESAEPEAPAAPEESPEPESPAAPEDGPDGPVPEAGPQDGPLSEDEMSFFSEIVFNNEAVPIRNQFLTSFYEAPEDVDLYELFYNGLGEPVSGEELAAFEAAGGFVECDVSKISTAAADALLRRHLGLALEETNRVNLDYLTYMPEYDAYYLAHGDTNALGRVEILAGEREGELVRLYYADPIYDSSWDCVTMRLGEDEFYQFVSNLPCKPAELPNMA